MIDETNVYDLSKLKIVVADQSRFVRQLLAAVLTGLRAPNPFAADSSEVALRIISETAPDLLIVDWDLQPMSGADFVRALRDETSSPSPTLPIIMISGHCALERVTQARDIGANEFIAKPFTVDAIYKRLVALIERPRPFIRLESYFGPDRRRKLEEFAGDERRRVNPNPIMSSEDAA